MPPAELRQFDDGPSAPELLGVVAQREKFYLDQRRSVVPLLFDLGGDTPEAVAARIERSRAFGFPRRWYTEAEWRRIRADGRAPD